MGEVMRQGFVYVQGVFAGLLSETDEGYTYKYDPDYLGKPEAVSVSLTLPLTDEEYRSNVLFPFFDGLIPEGWLLDVAVRNWKLSYEDRFGILLLTARDCIGDVEIYEEAKK
ncbi:MAG: HipA N-terminal domain-containing protein [Clostridiales bacterium]|nr:HipA N-terminal domain-containing protein [Clostridiales bacterium]